MNDQTEQPLLESFKARELEVLHLVAEGWSNREIAEELVIAVSTVRWYMKHIYSKLGVHSRTLAIAQARKLGLLEAQSFTVDENGTSIEDAPKHNLPAPTTRFIGRQREIAEIIPLLNTTRLLTLTGPGGSGKTRLALRVASDVLSGFPDGVLFVSLASLSDPHLVVNAIADALGIIESASQALVDTLKSSLHDKNRLLLIDNFEHVIQAAPLVSDLLTDASQLKILVTSREVLHLYGEQEYSVPPLSVPDLQHPEPLAALEHNEAVKLFVQSAIAVKPNFQLTPSNALTIAEICVRLDGLPLALELAAARSKWFTPQVLLERLDSRLDTLTSGTRDVPARQRTLRNTIDWSYNLLDDDERLLFERMSVFRGGRSLEAIERVGGENLASDLFDKLASLVDKSLVLQQEDRAGEPRFWILETIQEYARECLVTRGDAEVTHRQHAVYFTELAEQAALELRLAQQAHWIRRLDIEHDNLVAALEWSLGVHDPELGMRLVSALRDFWVYQGHTVEGKRWTDRALELNETTSLGLRAQVLNTAGVIVDNLQDQARAKQLHREALTIFYHLEDEPNIAWTRMWLASASIGVPEEYDDAISVCEEILTIFQELNDRPGMAMLLNVMGELARNYGDYDRARSVYEEALVISHETGEKRRESMLLANLGAIAFNLDDYDKSEALLKASLALSWELNFYRHVAATLATIAGVTAHKGQLESAAHLLGVSAELYDSINTLPQPGNLPSINRITASIRQQIGDEVFETARAHGRTLELDSVMTDLLADFDADASDKI